MFSDVQGNAAAYRPLAHIYSHIGKQMQFTEIAWDVSDNTSINAIKKILALAEQELGNGRLAITIESETQKRDNYLFHYFYPAPHSSFEDVRKVSQGDIGTCIEALHTYVLKNRVQDQEKPYTPEQVAATIGLDLPRYDRRATLGLTDRDRQETAVAKYITLAGPDMEAAFRDGWRSCVTHVLESPYSSTTHGDERHAWYEGWRAADRYLSA